MWRRAWLPAHARSGYLRRRTRSGASGQLAARLAGVEDQKCLDGAEGEEEGEEVRVGLEDLLADEDEAFWAGY